MDDEGEKDEEDGESSQPPQPPIASTEAPQMVSSVKLPMLKKGECILWTMKMEQYLSHTDYALWEHILARTRERKVKSTLLMAIPDEHLARFHGIKDAKTLWAAIKTRFGDVVIEDANQIFFRSLPLAWSNISLIMRNKPGIDNMDIDDLYNNLKVYEVDIKGSFGSSSNSQNAQGSSSYADELMFLFFSNQSYTPHLDKGDLEQIDRDDLKEMDLKWQVVMLSMRISQEFREKSRDVRNTGYRGRDNGKRPAKEEDKQALVVHDRIGYDSQFNEKEVLNIKEEEVTKTVFDNRSSDEENSVANDRFKKGEGYHTVPPPLTGNYMPSKPDLSFAGLDDSIYKKPKEDRSSSPLIEDWKTDSDDDSVFTPEPIPAKIDFVKAEVFTRSSRIPVSAAKPKAAASTSAAKLVNIVGPKQSVNFSRTRSTFHKSHSPIRSFYKATAHSRRKSTERVNTAGSKAVCAVKENGVTIVKTSAGCVWRPRVNARDQLSNDNRWICTRVDYGHPQQALKNKGIVDIGCSRHMTGNKAYLADYQEIYNGGFIAFGLSRASTPIETQKPLVKDEFWNTAISKLVNPVKQIHAIVNGKAVVISESSMRSDLLFNDEDAPEGEGSTIPTEPQPTPSTSQPNISATQTVPLQTATHPTVSHELQTEAHIEQILPSPSTYQRKHRKTHKPRKAKKVTELPQTSVPLDIGVDEAVHQEEGDSVERANTTGASLFTAQDNTQTRFETASKRFSDLPLSTGYTVESGEDRMEQETDLTDFVPPIPHDLPLSEGHTPGSDEGRPIINELMNLCTQLSNRVLALDQFKTAQDLGRDESKEAKDLNLSDKGSGETEVFDYTTAVEKDVNAVELVSTVGDAVNATSVVPDVSVASPFTSTAGDIFKDEMITMADTLIDIRRTRPRTTSVVIHDVEKEPRRAIPPPIVQSQDKEEQAQFEREQRIAREKATEQEAKDAALIQQIEDVQARIDADALLSERLQQKEREQFTVDEQDRMLVDLIAERKREQKWINDFVPMDSEEVNDSEQQAEVPVYDIAIDVESLATKYPIGNVVNDVE
uniref:Ribonuclease H-like domain-containing protein n=1 Tax=Tanacetum cinerariifolium TaxID=118510 RepID=A0A6L2MUR6_TANCI|nr:ribonuclease H-like domain-containing protein [Tanacetum cinerariifolium]